MKYRFSLFMISILCCTNLQAQQIPFGKYSVHAVSVLLKNDMTMGKAVIRVEKDSLVKAVDEPTFARLENVNFTNGIIEVKVLSKLLSTAPAFARGFIGVAFRINENNTRFENIYIRPTNGRADDQVRRNHSIQYYSYPDYKFDRLRKESPEKYESYADMELNRWITLRIEVKDATAKLFIDNNPQPSLVVNDLKLGPTANGAIGLWVDVGTEGYFKDLKIIKQ